MRAAIRRYRRAAAFASPPGTGRPALGFLQGVWLKLASTGPIFVFTQSITPSPHCSASPHTVLLIFQCATGEWDSGDR